MVQEGTNLSKKWIYGGWVRGGPSEGAGNDNPFLEIRKNSWFLFNGGGGGQKEVERLEIWRGQDFVILADRKSGGFDPVYVLQYWLLQLARCHLPPSLSLYEIL
jgi:hypothetical protein